MVVDPGGRRNVTHSRGIHRVCHTVLTVSMYIMVSRCFVLVCIYVVQIQAFCQGPCEART